MSKKNSEINQVKENLVSTLRAMTVDEALQVEFDEAKTNNFFGWDQNLVSGGSVALPFLLSENLSEAVVVNPVLRLAQQGRAASDLAAAYILFHDFAIHAEKIRDEQEQKFFDEFEKIRVISEIKNSYFGAAKNILHKVESDIYSGSTSLSLILLEAVFGENILPRTKIAILDLKENLSKNILQEIKNLAEKTSSQSDFALGVEGVLELLKKEQNQEKNEEEKENSKKKSDEKDQKSENNLNNFGQENVAIESDKNFAPNDQEDGVQEIEKEQKILDLKESDEEGKVAVKLDKQGSSGNKIEFKNPYKVYTTKFDEVVFPQKLVSKNDLELLRDQLDLKVAKLNSISKKMTLKLKKKLLSKRNSFLEVGATGGILNRKKLTRLVVDPFVEDIWISNKDHEYQNTCLTILLDNSGSMRGNPIVMSAMACEIIAGILEKFSIKTEIIGFTTADWKGGKARKLWESEGRPKNPGRLNELRHIIYKHFNQSFKKSKVNLGLMLKEGLLKENIDGEALLFARSRLMQQSEKRKILLVISDGTPVDDSTNAANDSDILTDHLHHVINKIENSSQVSTRIEIVGIGIGHSTEEFYRNSIAIKSLEELGDVMIEKIVDLL